MKILHPTNNREEYDGEFHEAEVKAWEQRVPIEEDDENFAFL